MYLFISKLSLYIIPFHTDLCMMDLQIDFLWMMSEMSTNILKKGHSKKSWRRNEKSDALKKFQGPADEAASLLMYEIWTLRDKVTYIWLT